MGIDKSSNGYNPEKQYKLKELSKEYGIDLSIVRRIAIINNYSIPLVVDELEKIYERNNKSSFENRLKEYKPKNNLE
jgi:hypothetical protein